ncbi:MAG: 5'-methylthioadenosine/S-adenosylhomocysteine nucleosidase family protein [Acidimicrobiales bacterium]
MSQIVVLAPMPLEMDAIVTAFALDRVDGATATGRVGGIDVTATHIGMGPPATRAALRRLFDSGAPVAHVMIAGICGGLDPDLPVGTLINPDVVVDHLTGSTYRHAPPGGSPTAGKLVTTEKVMFDIELSRRLFAEGCVGVDMETSAVAEVCEEQGCPWSVYRCIGDRYVDGLLDERLVALSNQDGSANLDEVAKLLAAEPDLAAKMQRLGSDAMDAARRAAEAALRACSALEALSPEA